MATTFTAKDVQSLRKATGAGMMDAKRALEANDGDPEAATRWLREKGMASMAGRADRDSSQGSVAMVTDETGGALVQLRCETDFVAKSEAFTTLTDELAAAVLSDGADAVERYAERIDDLRVTLKEVIEPGRVVRLTTSADTIVGGYLHVQDGRGVNGVLVELRGGDAELARGIGHHAAFHKPRYVHRSDVPDDVVVAERETLENLSRNEGKPEAALGKIVEGRMNGFFAEHVLMEQKYVHDTKSSVAEVLRDVELVAFEQVVVGE